MIYAEQPCETSNARASLAVWPCSSPGTGPRRCTAGTPLSAKGTSAQGSTNFTHLAQGQGQGQLRGKGGFVAFVVHPNIRFYNQLENMPGWRNWQTHRT